MKKILLSALALLDMAGSGFAQNLPSYVPANGLVGWWPFNGNANDESGNGNNGTVNGATLTTDRFGNAGKAYYFDGNSKIVLNQHFLNGAFSLVVWLKVTENQPGFHGSGSIFSNGIRHGNFGNGIHGYISTLNNVVGMEKNPFLNGQGGYSFQSPQINPMNDNSYHCLVFSWNGNTGPNSVFIHHNGVLIASSSCSSSNINSSRNLELGFGTDGGANYPFKGIMDDVIIYNRALTQQEITALYQGGNTTASCLDLPANLQQGLVGYWPFCGNALDESGNNNHGTVNGATLASDRFGNAGSAYSFDGNDNIIVAPVSTTSGISASFWTKDVNVNEGGHIITQTNSSSIVYWAFEYLANTPNHGNKAGSYKGLFNSSCSSNVNNELWHNTLDINLWKHITFTISDSGRIKIYQDGQLVQNSIFESFPNCPADTNSSLRIGGPWIPGDPKYFHGTLDDIAIWNRALSPQEITQLYNQGICKTSITVTDTLLIHTGITSYNPVAYQNTLKVWPNPGNQDITLDAGNLASMQGWKYKVANTLGQTVVNETAISQQQTLIDLSTWGGNGIYYLHLINPQGHAVEIKKIVLAP
jgi:hypothetical protein